LTAGTGRQFGKIKQIFIKLTCLVYSSITGKAQPITKSEANINVNITGDYRLTWGPKFDPDISFAVGAIKLGMEAQFGIEISGTATSRYLHYDLYANTRHECDLCINGSIYFFARAKAKGSLGWELLKLEVTIAEWRFYIGNLYLSLINLKVG